MPDLKPVVFIPGFPASELKQKSRRRTIFPPSIETLLDRDKRKELIRLLNGPDNPPGDIVPGEPIREVFPIAKQAQSLYDILRRFGYTPREGGLVAPIGWDWRLAVDHKQVQDDVEQAIDRLSGDHGRKVVVIAHSTGGLVLRALLEARPKLAKKIDQILAFGVPWAGTLKAVLYLAKGETFGLAIAGRRIVGLTPSEVRDVMSHCQAAYDLFPPDPAKTEMKTAQGKKLDLVMKPRSGGGEEQMGLLADLVWIPPGPSKDFMREMARKGDERLGERSSTIELDGETTPPITNVVGWGVETDTRCKMSRQGEITFDDATKEGDGTVPLVSASWLRGPGVRTFFLPIGVYPTGNIPNPHARIWDSPPVLEIFEQVLRDKRPEPFVCAAADGDQAIDRRSDVTIRLVAAGPEGNALANARFSLRTPGSRSVSFGGSVRKEVVLRRGDLRGNAAPDLFRFVIDVTWGGGGPGESREIPMLIRV